MYIPKEGNEMMDKKKILKKICKAKTVAGICLAAVMTCYAGVGVKAGEKAKAEEEYTDTMQAFLAGLVPEEGLTIDGRTYDYWDVLSFLDEVRWAPDDYVHKDHHCALSRLPQEDVRAIVQFLRVLMNCPKTYADYETVLAVQEALNEEGFNCGPADGLLGPMTYEALNAYQEENDLRVINAVTDEVLEGLGLEEAGEQQTEKETER